MRNRVAIFGTGLIFAFALTVPASAEESAARWAHWRGPSYQGYSSDTRVPLTWSDSQNLLWKTPLPGRGNSTPIIWGDRLFLTAASANGAERWVVCLRASDGKLLWQHTVAGPRPVEKSDTTNGFASASCATDGRRVYAFFGSAGLFCLDADNGKAIWQQAFGTFTNKYGWGWAASPFLFEDLVIQNCDNDGSASLPPGAPPDSAAPMALIALDKQTGEIRWRTERNQGIGFSTPVLIPSPAGTLDLVLNGPYGVWAYDPRTGTERWFCERHKGTETAKFGEPLPVFSREALISFSGRPGPAQAVRLGGSGDVSKTHVLWDVPRSSSRDIGSGILWNDLIFAANREGFINCQEFKTGRFVFKERVASKMFFGSPVLVREKLLFPLVDGTTFVVEPGETLKIVGRNRLTDATDFRASPAIADGRLYLRSQAYCYCIGDRN